ncbi:uncharacterized protein LOC128546152 [Mercenaria mercenaria]|uniref:uncharacterized protein LOC128546152 n=1 Tax=Mercenaria mercenaria TaxID=6596 RepID=UPI00234F8928|nr:uncharacterized protein LOC128546152 [Mercenaria mercenaria]
MDELDPPLCVIARLADWFPPSSGIQCESHRSEPPNADRRLCGAADTADIEFIEFSPQRRQFSLNLEDQSSNQTNDAMSAEEYFGQDDIQLAIEEISLYLYCFRLLSKAVAEASLCGPEGNMIFVHDGEKLERMTSEMYGKLTAYNVLNGGPGLPMINTILYSFMTDQGIKPHVDILTLSQTEEISRMKEVCNLFHAEINQLVNGLDKVGSLQKEILHAFEAFSSLFVTKDR